MSPNLTSFASFYPYIYMCGSGSVFRIPKLLNMYISILELYSGALWIWIHTGIWIRIHTYKYRDKNGQKMSD